MSLLTDPDAFYTKHRRCGDLDAGVDWPIVYPIGKSWRTGLLPHAIAGHVYALSYSNADERVLRRVLQRLRRGGLGAGRTPAR
jgi:hypothetical protein